MTRTTERALLCALLPWAYPIGCHIAARLARKHLLDI